MIDRPVGVLEPGQWVRHPECPDWGLGQVQTVIGDRVTVNFEEAGKKLVNVKLVSLDLQEGPPTNPAS